MLRTTPQLTRASVARARALRRDKTPAERRLWSALRASFVGAHFRHQVPLGPYYADFASHGARLIVEVDGGQHTPERDAQRTRFLEGEGYKVLRFWNNEVLENLDGVLAVIAREIPSPLVGEGGLKGRMGGARQGRARAAGAHPHPSPPRKGEGGNDNLSVGVS
jgi:very-short-patch-repair endonuclease